ncbi:MAG: hypothetical protein WC220_10165 [Pedobacter sp.]|jgi:hypothetical protein
METENSNTDWLKEAPSLAKISKGNPFGVPSGYFESLPDDLNSRILLESVRFDQEGGFNIPANYFEHLRGKIEDRIVKETIQDLAPSGEFQVPEAYFANLSVRINSRIADNKAPASKKKIYTSWISYSAAASIVLIAGIFIYFNSSVYTFKKQLSKVPDQEIINYLQFHSTVSDTQYIIENTSEDGLQQVSTDISAEEIEQYINGTTL